MEEGFGQSLVLPDSHKHDSVLCVELADVDWDGQQEIVLGTFGKVTNSSTHTNLKLINSCVFC